ncbi:MAG: metallophosphoesterase [Planctomycetota bacterium]
MITRGLLVLLALLGNGYVWIGLINRLHAVAGRRKLIDALTYTGFGAFCLLGLVTAVVPWHDWATVFSPGGSTPLAAYGYACAAVGALQLLRRLLPPSEDRPAVLLSQRSEPAAPDLPWGAVALHGSAARLMGRLPYNEVRRPVVEHKELAVPGLPEPLVGLVVCHLSDLHMTGRTDRAFYELLGQTLERLKFDVLAVTGDVIEKEACRPWLNETLAGWRAPLGVYYVLGNHDLYIDDGPTRETIDRLGWTPTVDRWVEAEWRGVSVAIGGSERPWYGGEPGAPPPREACPFRVVLSHTPDRIGWARGVGAELVLAGHTHGGQIRPPVLGPIASPSSYGTRFASGSFLVGRTAMHVSRGVSGKTPLRWNCPPEIALLTLRTG